MNDDTRQRATLRDVARAAGVSHTTVSNAFSRPDQLSAPLREHVLAIARTLGYAGPDPAARSLRTGYHGALGLVFSEDLPYAFSDRTATLFLQGVAEACRERHANLLLIATRAADETPPTPGGGLPNSVRDAAVDGFILYSLARDNPVIAPIQARGLPLVVVDQPRLPDVAYVGIDDFGAARQVAEHLLALGHRRFAVLSLNLRPDGQTGPASPERIAAATYEVAAARLNGYRAAFAAAGVEPATVPVLECALNDERQARDMTLPLLLRRAATDRPSAILAMSDRLALGAAAAAREAGLAVPGDLSVAGFDDIAGSTLPELPLTTIRQPHAEKGRTAVRMLTAPVLANARILATELVVRASSGRRPDLG
jgi:DNA-binding LacI/PurR family transcriptional regulator